MRLSEAFEQYRQDVIVFGGQSPKTEENHNVCLRSLANFFGDPEISDITPQMIRDWKFNLDKNRSSDTVRNYVIRFRVVLAHLQKMGIPCVNYELIPVPKRKDKVPTYISKEDVAKLIEVVSKPVSGYAECNRLKNAAIISLLFASGIRVSELCQLNRGDLQGGTFTVIGKGSKARLCFYDDRTAILLQLYLNTRTDQNQALFVSGQTGLRITPGSVQKVFRLASQKAGFTTPIHPHVMRHSFATNMLKNNANLRYVQEFLGHSSIQTTQMYTHVVNRDLEVVYRSKHSI